MADRSTVSIDLWSWRGLLAILIVGVLGLGALGFTYKLLGG